MFLQKGVAFWSNFERYIFNILKVMLFHEIVVASCQSNVDFAITILSTWKTNHLELLCFELRQWNLKFTSAHKGVTFGHLGSKLNWQAHSIIFFNIEKWFNSIILFTIWLDQFLFLIMYIPKGYKGVPKNWCAA